MIVEISEKRALAIELLDLMAKISGVTAKIDELKDKLKACATTAGRGFSESVEGKGKVSVRAPTEGKFQGLMPELDPELFLAAKPAEQERLKASGIVSIVSQYGRGSAAAVTVELGA